MVIQPTAKHLIVGTHGRSLYKADIAPLQLMTDKLTNKNVHVFKLSSIRKDRNWGSLWSKWGTVFTPKITIPFYVKTAKKVTINIFNKEVLVNSFSLKADTGYNEAFFDVSFSKKSKKSYQKAAKKSGLNASKNSVYYLPKDEYTVEIL